MASRRMNNATARDPATFRLDLATAEYEFFAGARMNSPKAVPHFCTSACLDSSLFCAAWTNTLPNASEIFDESNIRLWMTLDTEVTSTLPEGGCGVGVGSGWGTGVP